jgi:two-component system response regulator ChvI
MVVDDQYDIVHLLRRQLERKGYDVDTFTNPLYALEIFRQNPSRYSLLITDISMPELRGTVLARELQKIRPEIKVVVMTAFDLNSQDFEFSLPAIKPTDILKKPISLDQVVSVVKAHLESI